MLKKIRSVKPRSQKERKMSLLYVIAAIFCFANYKTLLLFGFVFIVLAVANFLLSIKHSASEEKVEEFIKNFNNNEQDEEMIIDASEVFNKKKKTQIEKKEYNKFLSELEDELGDFEEQGE